MGAIRRTLQKIQNWAAITIGKIHWKPRATVTESEYNEMRAMLKEHYFIIATRHSGHLSTHVISLLHFFLTGKYGYYAHVLMNLEDDVTDDDDYRFIEATSRGTHFSGFKEAFDARTSSVALLKPKSMTLDKWVTVLERVKTQAGKPYDTLFDLSDDTALSCVELIRIALQAEPNYHENFANFEQMIARSKNLDPQMFYECSDFTVVWEVRH